MQHLLGDLLDMASIEAGTFSFQPTALDIGPILEDACQAHDASARARGLQLKLEHAHTVNVLGDRTRILQVMANLIGNAIKFSNGQGTIGLTANVGEANVTVAVSDTGPGIPSEDLQRIFEPYTTSPRNEQSGTGLGLYIARAIVERHGGRIWVKSQPGKGSTFFFTLPRAR